MRTHDALSHYLKKPPIFNISKWAKKLASAPEAKRGVQSKSKRTFDDP